MGKYAPSDSRYRSDLEMDKLRTEEAKEKMTDLLNKFEDDKEHYYKLPVYCRNCMRPFTVKVPSGWTIHTNEATRFIYYHASIYDREHDVRTYLRCSLCNVRGHVIRDEKKALMLNFLAEAKAAGEGEDSGGDGAAPGGNVSQPTE